MHLLFNRILYTNLEDRYAVLDYAAGTIYLLPSIHDHSGVAIHVVKHPRIKAEFLDKHGQEAVNEVTQHLFNYILQRLQGKALDKVTGKLVEITSGTIINLDAVAENIMWKQLESQDHQELSKESEDTEAEPVQ